MNVGAVRETFLHAADNDGQGGYLLGEPIVTDDLFTDDVGDLFRFAQREYGGCVSRIYIDTADGIKSVGWVFQRREAYEDDPTQTYLREVWVELLEKPDTITRTTHPYYLEV